VGGGGVVGWGGPALNYHQKEVKKDKKQYRKDEEGGSMARGKKLGKILA